MEKKEKYVHFAVPLPFPGGGTLLLFYTHNANAGTFCVDKMEFFCYSKYSYCYALLPRWGQYYK